MNRDDVKLLDAARRGSRSAINQLFAQHRSRIRQLVRMRLDFRTRQRVDISDVVQEIMIDASRRLDSYLANPEAPFEVWLRQIARDRIIDAWRKHRGSANRTLDRERPLIQPSSSSSEVNLGRGRARELSSEDVPHADLTPAELAMQREILLQVEEAVSALPKADSEIIVMRHFEFLSNGEVAAMLNLSEAAASIRYVRALKKLRQHLAPQL